MKRFALIIGTIISLISCTHSNFEKDKLSIVEVMDKQTVSWNKGDIAGFMNGYWKSDSLRFLGKRGLTTGWQKTYDNYVKAYPNKQTMGKLRFDLLSFELLKRNQMFVVGKWTLEREKDTVGGYYSLIWQKIDSDWKVVFDHTN